MLVTQENENGASGARKRSRNEGQKGREDEMKKSLVGLNSIYTATTAASNANNKGRRQTRSSHNTE